MCLGNRLKSDLSTRSGHSVSADTTLNPYSVSTSNSGQLTTLLANVRGLRQAAAELSKLANEFKPHLIGIVETHLQGDSLCGLLPHGYRCVNRLDRTKHGGGLLWLAKSHLLIDKIDMKVYNTVDVAEFIGIEVQDETVQLCYTPKSSLAPKLIEQCEQYMLNNGCKSVSFFGDFNVHNPEWICSVGDKDIGGEMAEDMCESFGLNQLIDFPTRGPNTLDLAMTPHAGVAVSCPGAGSSDHISILINMELKKELPEVPDQEPTYLWQYAPWEHIAGAIKRDLKGWDANSLPLVDDAIEDLDSKLQKIIDKYVKLSKPKKPGPIIWWDNSCQTAYNKKIKLFPLRFEKQTQYNAAINHCKTVQNRAFAKYQKELSTRLASMDKSDKCFWRMAKEIGGTEAARSSAAPSPEDLAVHFASKMSNGKDEEDVDFVPKDLTSVPLHSWKIRLKRVRQVLRTVDASKSANGISPAFWKNTALVLDRHITQLYKRIVREGTYPSLWKIQRVTPPHKRGSVKDAKNYRPLSVLVNLSVYFEKTVDPQFDVWVAIHTPENQFGFVKHTGTCDYGAALAFTIQQHLDRRGEGILISLDVAGAFDRVWWARLKARLKAKGMRRRALKLLYSYLKKRFIQVVTNGDASELHEIFSGVPQGAIWSPKLWDMDIAEMEYYLSYLAMLICYADDCGLWYAITSGNRDTIVSTINKDLDGLLEWGKDNKTTFEPTKTHFSLISNKTSNKFNLCFPYPRIMFDGVPVKRKPAVKLVGYLFDEKMTWSGMIDGIAKKARRRLGMLTRLRSLLDDKNMKCIYSTFIRPIMEYGSIQFMGAAPTHLDKLDAIQRRAERVGRFEVESLASRREAAAVAFTLKLLDGGCRGMLKHMVPTLVDNSNCGKRARDSRHLAAGIQLACRAETTSLDAYKRGYLGSIHLIWRKLPQELVKQGMEHGWLKIKKSCSMHLTGKTTEHKTNKKTKIAKKVVKVGDVDDGFTIDGFKVGRTNEFEVE